MHFPELVETLLSQRGIGPEDKDSFLNPDYTYLHDPMLLPDMEKARDRVIKAIRDGEHITVFPDYDADGVPGAVVLSDFFKRVGYDNVSFYIPHRHDEGFGLNIGAIEEIAGRGTKLLITVDCGVADHKEVARANELGIDVIVTDHHLSLAELPEAFAVVNPKRSGSRYPFHSLCGSGVVFKLVQAIFAKELFGVKEGMEKWSLDMVAIATLSDMVSLVDENRVLVKFGLDVLRKSPRPGLQALLNKLRIDQRNITEDDVVFMITPRINAASRMGVPEDAFKLLSTDSQVEAEQLAGHLEKINKERKGVVASIVKDAKAHLKQREKVSNVIVIGNPEWRPALAGLVASSLVDEYERPAFVYGRDGGGVLKGSCRSYNGYNLHALMDKASDSFIEFGGHAGAGGFSVTLESLITLEDKLSQALESLEAEIQEDRGSISLNLSDVGESLWSTVSQFAPFGMDNEKPMFKLSNVPVKSVRTFGKEGNHLELVLDGGIKAIAFFSSPATYNLETTTSTCTLHCTLEKSYFMNRPELRLRIVNIET